MMNWKLSIIKCWQKVLNLKEIIVFYLTNHGYLQQFVKLKENAKAQYIGY